MPPERNNSKKIWDSLGVKIGVVSGVLGIVLGIISIVSAFSPDEKGELEVAELQLKQKDYNPRLEIAYVVTEGDIYGIARGGADSLDRKKVFFVDFPVLDNRITSSDAILFPSHEEGSDYTTIYLMIQNKGKVAASGIQLKMDESLLEHPVKIADDSEGNNYQTRIESNSTKRKPITITLPTSLETGQGILIPLMVSEVNPRYTGPTKEWQVISKIAYLPRSVRYKNAVSEQMMEEIIRQMTAPVRLSDGVEVRG